MDPGTAGAAFGGLNLVATNALNARKKYKNTPFVYDAVIFAEKNLQETKDKSARRRKDYPDQFRKESDASVERLEVKAQKVLDEQQKPIRKAHKLKDKVDNKEGNWIGNARRRLAYDQYEATRAVANANSAASSIDRRHNEHDRNVAARELQRKEDTRRLRQQGGPPSLDSEATTFDSYGDEYESDYKDDYYHEYRNNHGDRYDEDYAGRYEEDYEEGQHSIPVQYQTGWAPNNRGLGGHIVMNVPNEHHSYDRFPSSRQMQNSGDNEEYWA